MKRTSRLVSAAFALGVVGLAGAQALAQGMGYGPGMGPGMMGGGGMHGGWGPMMGAYDQGWFDALKEKLAITPAQEKVWNAYVAAARANAESMIKTHNSMDLQALQKMSPQERIDFMRSMHEGRIDQMTAVINARDALIKTLDEKQRRLAVPLLGGRGGGMGAYGMGPGMMGWGGLPSDETTAPAAPPTNK